MEQALAANPFLEENPDGPRPRQRDSPVRGSGPATGRPGQAPPSSASRTTGAACPTRSRRCRSTCASSCACRAWRPRPRARRDGDRQPRRRRLLQGELRGALRPAAQGARRPARRVRGGARWCRASTRRGSRPARSRNACACSSRTSPPDTPGRAVALTAHQPAEPLANREWARLQHAASCNEREPAHRARAHPLARPRPGQRFGATEARYVIPDVIVRKQRERWVAIINPARCRACA